MIHSPSMVSLSFGELSPRERLAALFDDECYTEMLGPFDRIGSPWLAQQGLVPQSDDGVVVVRGRIDGKEVVGIAIEPKHEGGSIGEVGGAKIASVLQLAASSGLAEWPIAAVLLLESGGVRLQEATLGLVSIREIHTAIIRLRKFAPVVAVVAGPIGCFGGMSLAAALCTMIIGMPYGRLGMNGAEVIEQEAGPQELDASDRDLIWQVFGCEARLRDGFIDALVEDDALCMRAAVHDALKSAHRAPARLDHASKRLADLRLALAAGGMGSSLAQFDPFGTEQMPSSLDRGRLWLELLGGGKVTSALNTPAILTADVSLGSEAVDSAVAVAIVRDPSSMLPRATNGELGLEQAWTLAEYLRRFVLSEQHNRTKRPILAIVDSPGQAFGRMEEENCISVAAAAAVDAYAAARDAGHIVLTLIVGKAMSGSFLAHGLQSDYVCALEGEGVVMHAMSLQSIARVTGRTFAEVEENSASILPMSYAIQDAHRLGLIDALITGIPPEAPTEGDLKRVKAHLSEALATLRRNGPTLRNLDGNPYRQGTVAVRRAMREQWSAFEGAVTRP